MAVDYYYSYNQNEHKVQEEDEEEEDYIDMEVSSFAHFFSLSKNTPLCSSQHHNREFEFQMSSSSMNVEKESTTSPADELFYMGKLLPLHLPPRLQMVEKLLQDSTPKMFINNNHANNDEFYSTPLDTNAATTPITGHTPFESCNVSPVDSCQVSRELNPKEYFCVYASNEGDDQKGFYNNISSSSSSSNARKSWTKKLKTKIKSLFGKSGEVIVASSAVKNKGGGDLEKPNKESMSNDSCINQNQEVGVTQERFDRENEVKEVKVCHRRSFSGAFKRRSSTTNKVSSLSSSGLSTSSSSSSSSSSTSTSNSKGLRELLKRSSSANSEIETSLIQGAIAHCKQSSQQAIIQSRKALSDVGCHSFPSSRFTALDHETSHCRG
ncbi:putative membrane-associated kinase regulator 4 [Bienertia sinuspersici]